MAGADLQYVHTARSLDSLIDRLAKSEQIALDTEFIGEGNYEPLLCLVQLATEEGVWIVDPLAIADLSRLWELLTSPQHEMVALAAREEIRFCLRYARRPPARLFDPQIAAGLVGYGYPMSHTNLVRQVVGVSVNGRETFTDWRQRPLSSRQLEYAADDVRHLLEMRRRLLDAAEKLARVEWVEGECQSLVERVVEAEQEERWWRVSGSSTLNRRELAALRELWRWRDQLARTDNVPPRRVMRDEMLVEIARRQPTSTTDLYALRGLDRRYARENGPEIVEAVRRAKRLPDDRLPTLLRRDDPPQVAILSQLLAVASNSLAVQHRVDPALLATASDLQELVRWELGLTDPEPPPAVMEGWRGDILGRPLRELLEGRRIMRVADARAEAPLVFEPLPQ